jgi:glutathione S-transferase
MSFNVSSELPVLYSFRRCPYAMRARLAIASSGVKVSLREIELKNKPDEMLALSPKGTVPVLHLQVPTAHVIDESLDIMLWALTAQDPEGWMYHGDANILQDALTLIEKNDNEFKGHLDKYKYAVRFPEDTEENYRAQGEVFLQELNHRLASSSYLMGDRWSLADAAIAPFIRQFAHVDKRWFDQTDYSYLQQWLNEFLNSDAFKRVMVKYSPWLDSESEIIFPPTLD